MAKNILPYDQLTTEGSGFDMLGSAMRKAAGKSDMFDGKIEFKAVVIRGVTAGKLTAAANANVNGLDPGSSKQPVAAGNKAYRVRIIDENSPHSFLPDPCAPQVTGTANLLICDMHTLALSPDNYHYGDEVMIQLNKRDFSYNLDVAYITRKIGSNAERWGGGAKRAQCSQPTKEAFEKDLSGMQFLAQQAATGKTFFESGKGPVDISRSKLCQAAKAAGLPQESLDTFFEDLLKKIGGKKTDQTMKFLHGWSHQEQPSNLNNPLATTWPSNGVYVWDGDPGMTIFNVYKGKGHVKNYSTYDAGLTATHKTITNGRYPDLVKYLKQTLTDTDGNIIKDALIAVRHSGVNANLGTWGSTGKYDRPDGSTNDASVESRIRLGEKQTRTFISAKSLGSITSKDGVPVLPTASGPSAAGGGGVTPDSGPPTGGGATPGSTTAGPDAV